MNDRKTGRIGLYGGTFAPPHNGHVAAAAAFLREVNPDRLYVIPACRPPHKELTFADDPALRLRMAKAAFCPLDVRVEVSDFEIAKGGRSYTVDTLTAFSRRGEGELFFLCGTDMFLTLETWRNPTEIFRLATLVCVPRDGENRSLLNRTAEQYQQRYGARTWLLQTEPVVVSSTEVRKRLHAGDDVSGLIPAAVQQILTESGAYHEG